MPLRPYTVLKPLTMGIPSIRIMVYGPSMPLMWMSPVLHTPQLICGRTPFTMATASNSAGLGSLRNNAGVITSTGTGLSLREMARMVPVTTTSSNSEASAWRSTLPRSRWPASIPGTSMVLVRKPMDRHTSRSGIPHGTATSKRPEASVTAPIVVPSNTT